MFRDRLDCRGDRDSHNYASVEIARQLFELPELPLDEGAGTGDVTVVIPARNEAANIARVVESFTGVPVIVVDDDSSDGTAELALQAGAIVLALRSCSEAHWANRTPARRARGLHIRTGFCLLTPTLVISREFLPSIMHYARSEKLDMVTVFLRQERRTMAEKLFCRMFSHFTLPE